MVAMEMYNLFVIIILLLVDSCFGNQNRIIGGGYVDPKRIPYIVALKIFSKGIAEPDFCSGSLITAKFVLTAGHCIFHMETVYVGLGVESRYSHRHYIKPKSVRVHEQYNPRGYGINDIGLIELSDLKELEGAMETVNLPSKSNSNCSYMGRKATVSGWGDRGNYKMSKRLKFLKVVVVPNDQCPFNVKTNERICAKSKKSGRVCQGDSGAALVIRDPNNTLIQIGILSFGTLSCLEGLGSFYMRVTQYLDWIEVYSDYKF